MAPHWKCGSRQRVAGSNPALSASFASLRAMRAKDVIALPTGQFTFPLDYDYPGQTGLVVAYAIRHPGGIFLFDTGFAPAGPELDEFYLSWKVQPRDMDEVFDEAGIDRAEITAIANCHLHLDHSGGNSRFPGLPIYVQKAEWAAAHEPDYTYLPSIDFQGATYIEVDGEVEPLPGMRIIPTPGHSPGHQSLVIDSPDGPLLLAGQAVYSRGEWVGLPDAREGASTAGDREAYTRSIERLKALRPKEELFGHDRQGWP
jgi:N-acyl homoserine lactone hydrolase